MSKILQYHFIGHFIGHFNGHFVEYNSTCESYLNLVFQPAVRAVGRTDPTAFKQFSDRSSPAEYVAFQSFKYACVLPSDYLLCFDRRAPAAKNLYARFLLRGTYGQSTDRNQCVWRTCDVLVTCASRTISSKFARRQPVEHVRQVVRLA